MILELAHPELLLLMLLLGILWILLPMWRPRIARQRPVASTLLWHRAIPEPRSKRPLMPLLLAFALILIASTPRIIPEGDPSMVPRRLNDGAVRIEIRLAGETGGFIGIAGKEPQGFSLTENGEAVIDVGDLEPRTLIEVSIGTRRHTLTAPGRVHKALVSDLSSLPQVADALEVLEKSNRIEISSTRPDVVISRNQPRDSSLPSIVFPDQEGTLILPRVVVDSSQPALLDGLHPRYWTVLRASEVEGDAILVDEAGRSLLARDEEGFSWGFLPGDSDLAQRSDWPVLLGRLIEELAPSPATATDSSLLAGAGLHLSLILALLTALLTPILLGSQGRLPALCIVLAIIVGQVPSTAKPLPDHLNLEQFSAGEAPATMIQVPSRSAPASPELQRLIRSRGIHVELKKSDDRRLGVHPERIRSGQTVSIVGNEAVDSFEAISPEGQRIETPSRWSPSAPGAWLIEDEQGEKVTLVVEEAIPAALWCESGSAAQNLLPTPTFSTTLAPGHFPEPTAGAVIVWNSVPIDDETAQSLHDWIGGGGTFIALPADPFCEDESTRKRLAALLPTEIPAPPLPPVQDLGILLLDLSGSLSGAGATTLLAGTLAILEGSRQNSLWGIAGFREQPHWIFPPGTRLDRTVLQELDEQITTGGGTDLGSALRFCLETLTESEGGRSLVVITDGRSTPDDWEGIGSALRDNEIDYHMVLVGEPIERNAVDILQESSAGTLHRARSPQHARAILNEVVKPDEKGWQSVRSPVLAASLHEFLDAAPPRPPVPLRRLSIDSTSIASGGKVLWVDGNGAPLLAIRSIGDGISVVWYSGLDEFSLSGKAPQILEHLSQLIAGSADRRKEPRRRGFLVEDQEGQTRLALQRRDDDPLTMNVSLGSIGGELSEFPLKAVPGSGWLVSQTPLASDQAGAWWQQGRSIDAGVIPAQGNVRRWRSIIGSGQIETTRLGSPSLLLLLIAMFLLLSSRGNRWSDLLRHRDREPVKDLRY
ncbi:MAG: VWA domain-containing protein [Planctomycetota bacterium]|nr:VWA domain-containing protein [Planctomycetota bacterium]